MRLVFLGLLVATGSSAAHAAPQKPPPKPPADLVPYGSGWFCVHPLDPKAPGAETPRCERTEAACRATRAGFVEPAKLSACEAQPSATVVTYYDPKRARWRFLASPDDDGCLELRTGLVDTRAYQRVSQCEEIGRRFPPPAKLATAAITPGKTWWCIDTSTSSTPGARPLCARAVAACEDAIRRDAIKGVRCKQQGTAFVMTWKDEPPSTSSSFSALSSATSCSAYREQIALAELGVSECHAIGEIARPKVDRKRVPRGSGWSCFEGRDPAHPLGACARTVKDCAAQFELDRYVLGAAQACHPQRTAYGRNIQDQFVAFPTLALCEAHIADHPDGSRCEAL